MNSVHAKIRYKCDSCDNVFKSKASLKNHVMVVHLGKRYLSQKDKTKCDICAKEFTLNHTLKTHNRLLHSSKEHPCDICNEILPSKFDFNQHNEKKHVNEKKCQICGKMFSSNKNVAGFLKRHIKTVHDLERFRCDQCTKTFDLEENLKTHVKVVHLKQRLKCDLCEKSFQNKVLLSKHVKSFHERERFHCKECDKLFTTDQQLKIHVKSVHQGIRWTCEECLKEFAHPNCLKNTLMLFIGE